MTKTALTFKTLKIHKAPGFPNGLPAMENLNNNINIITGANASGKSTTARTIQALIWKNDISHLHAEATVKTNADWFLKIDHGSALSQKAGKNEPLPNIPDANDRRLYMLAIHDLIQKEEEEHDLADEIMKESIGGYDLDEAKNTLGFEDKISNIRTNEYQTYIKAEKDFKELKQIHASLKHKEKKLDNLHAELNKTRQAEKLTSWYQALADYLKAKQETENINQRLEQFPITLKDVMGKEVKEAEDLVENIRNTKITIEQTEKEIDELQNSLDNLHIPRSGVSEKTLTTLEEYVKNLDDNEKQIRDIDKETEGIISEEKECIKNINPGLEPGEWDGITLNNISDLDKFLTNAHNVFAKEHIIRKEIERIEKEISDESDTPDSNTLTKGIDYLGQWLKTPVRSESRHTWLIPAMIIAAIVTAVLCFLFGWPGLFGLILVIGLPLISNLQHKKQDNQNNILTTRETDYRKTGLDSPSSWNPSAVTDQLDTLIKALHNAEFKKFSTGRLNHLHQLLEDLKSDISDINQTHQQWLDKLKAVPNLPDTAKNDFSSMYWFLKNIIAWQQVHTKHSKLLAERAQIEKEQGILLKKCNDIFSGLQLEHAGDAAEANGLFKTIKTEEDKRKRAEQQQSEKNKTIEQERKRLVSLQSKYNEIFTRLHIDTGDMHALQQLTDLKSDYDEINQEAYAAQKMYNVTQQNMKQHSLYDEHKADITSLSPDEIKEHIREQQVISNKWEKYSQQIIEIEHEIKKKKEEQELEILLSQKEEASRKLEALYENNMASITGNIVIETLKQTHREKNQPEVLKRGGSLFNKITNGRYELLTDEHKNKTVFKAKDTILKESQPLSELSTGTRVQLILAVRLAFIEHNETALSLPLLADELLANSDDIRAKAIIETLITISKEGRQVFYFTAQEDEAFKWKSMLDKQENIDYAVVPLDDQNKDAPARHIPHLPTAPKLTYNVPPPEGKTHEAYAASIKPPDVDLLRDSSNKLHLWYLIEDTELLYRCLSQGIVYWGQLKSFLNHQGQILGLTDKHINKLQEKATIVDNYLNDYRSGRPKPIDRSVLINSNVIKNDKFIDEMDELLKSLNGNPKKLIEALKQRKVARLQNKYIEELNAYLEDNGYIDNAVPMPHDEIQNHITALVSTMSISPRDAEQVIKRLIT
ncbi:MAG: ATP-binding protein [Bacteroidales bacterium]